MKKKKNLILELEYSKNILLNNIELKNEICQGKFNSQRNYLLTENFYIDFNRKTIVKFAEIDNIKLKFTFSFMPFIESYGLNQFIHITTKDKKQINILNWSFSHHYPESGEIYEIFIEKMKKSK